MVTCMAGSCSRKQKVEAKERSSGERSALTEPRAVWLALLREDGQLDEWKSPWRLACIMR